MKKLFVRNGQYYYTLRSYSLLRVMSFERFAEYFRGASGGDLAIDYGAGDRPSEQMLRTKFRGYLAADHVDTCSSYGDGRPPDILLNGGILPLADASVDCVVLTEVLEHIYDPHPVLADLKRVLKPGGIILGSVPFAIQHHDEPHDYHRYTYHCLKKMFEQADLQIQELDYIGDMVAVGLNVFVGILEVFPRSLDKMRVPILGTVVRTLIRLPLFVYYYARKAGLDPGKLAYFRRYPLGFTFSCARPRQSA